MLAAISTGKIGPIGAIVGKNTATEGVISSIGGKILRYTASKLIDNYLASFAFVMTLPTAVITVEDNSLERATEHRWSCLSGSLLLAMT